MRCSRLFLLLLPACMLTLVACNTLPKDLVDGYSDDPDYGYVEDKPIEVGGFAEVGHRRQYDFIARLRGPAGEDLQMERLGSCCEFQSANSPFGSGFLDVWQIDLPDGTNRKIYISSYDRRNPKVPQGFTFAGLGDPPANSMRTSLNQKIIDAYRTMVKIEDGLEQDEAVILAQYWVVMNDESAKWDLYEPQVTEPEGDTLSWVIAFEPRGEKTINLVVGEDSFEDQVIAAIKELFLIVVVSPDGQVQPLRSAGAEDK